ncbi:ATPase [Actinotalea ferrariae CF5-4]|uniref:ATPase n=1 Tax=Actinotalea ferrariae CF5-4 TaxID=948458 RepID=A0A021VS94_9CELL|nr:ATP-binding protein [Actinotalea ferrariae]EYR63998.1 ATPase [Actinotalea ferrariae CF5-4]
MKAPHQQVTLDATGDSIRRGRSFAVRAARDLGVGPQTLAVVELLASELVTNAVKFGGTNGVVRVGVRPDGNLLRMEVSDCSGTSPTVDAGRPAHLGGHGMKLVETLCEDWGVTRDRVTGGKTVWLTLAPDCTFRG